MQKDFTLGAYISLLENLQNEAYNFLPFSDFILSNNEKAVCLRHDVDLLPSNSLKFAKIQNEKGIRGTFFFRAVPESWDEEIIKQISYLGHEIGYHYENMSTTKGDTDAAIKDFEMNLEKLRNLSPVNTICMHGSPKSKYDSKDLWKYYDYRDFGIIGEPYFDIDFSNVAYYTDTGRMWDGHKFSVRDKISYIKKNHNEVMGSKKFPQFHSTKQFVIALKNGDFPLQVMLTFHPQRWSDKPIPWFKELFFQNTKNIVKYFIIKMRKR